MLLCGWKTLFKETLMMVNDGALTQPMPEGQAAGGMALNMCLTKAEVGQVMYGSKAMATMTGV